MDDFPVFSRAQAQAEARDSLARNLRAALDDAEDLVRLTAEHVAAARSRAQASVAKARNELERVQAEAVERTRQTVTEVDDYVHTHPWQAIALAGVLSAVIGVLIARR